MRKRVIGKLLSLVMILSLLSNINVSKAEVIEKEIENQKNTLQEDVSLEIASKGDASYESTNNLLTETSPCVVYDGTNINKQDYYAWTKPINSYMTECSNGNYMIVEKIKGEQKIYIRYYDNSYNVISNSELEYDLPIFGGFYETDNNFYLVTGQLNLEKDDNVEVIRITKYDKNWNRISSCRIFGANTIDPFDCGAVRIEEVGNYLIIRTGHTAYDGHQSNVTIQVNMNTMEVTDKQVNVSYNECGYISHSFNQFICSEENKIVAVDHGDAYPRAVVLVRYPNDVTRGKFNSNECKLTRLINFPDKGEINYTGVSVGGFEISDTSYIVAANQDKNKESISYESYCEGRDIIVAVMDKNTESVSVKQITNYEKGRMTSTPHLTKIGSNSYMLLWHEGSQVYYVKLDGNGNTVGSICSVEGNLSDCKPILCGKELIWYTHNNEIINFYNIDVSSMVAKKNEINTEHYYQYGTTVTDGQINKKCVKCGYSCNVNVPTYFNCFWLHDMHLSDEPLARYDIGDEVICCPYFSEIYEESVREMEVFSSDENIISIEKEPRTQISEPDFIIHALNSGITILTIRPKYNPSLEKKFVIKIGSEGEVNIKDAECSLLSDMAYTGKDIEQKIKVTYKGIVLDEGNDYSITYSNNKNVGEATVTITGKGLFSGEIIQHFNIFCKKHTWDEGIYFLPTCLNEGTKIYTCHICKETKTDKIPALGHYYSIDWTIDKKSTCLEEGIKSHHCIRCNSVTDKTIIPKIEHKWNSGEVIKQPTYDSEGIIRYTCLNCTSTKDESISRLDIPAEIPENVSFVVNSADRFGLSATLSINNSDLNIFEYSWYAKKESGDWFMIQNWNKSNNITWTPDVFGNYSVVGKVRANGHPETEQSASYVYEYHPQIKGKCQMPYSGEQGVGYLIGVESYENPNQSYQYEMLILDCTLLAQGLPAWTYTTGKFTVPEGNAGWCIWTPQYGYYWTLFRVYDENGVLIDEQCYGFQNI